MLDEDTCKNVVWGSSILDPLQNKYMLKSINVRQLASVVNNHYSLKEEPALKKAITDMLWDYRGLLNEVKLK